MRTKSTLLERPLFKRPRFSLTEVFYKHDVVAEKIRLRVDEPSLVRRDAQTRMLARVTIQSNEFRCFARFKIEEHYRGVSS